MFISIDAVRDETSTALKF